MKKKSFAIIGGGLSGCASALYLRSKGHDVSIYEKDDSLGGVARDLRFDKKIYFNGPNYLDPNSLLIELIKKEKFFKKIINTKNLLYGSYTDIFGEENISNNFAHPVASIKFKKKNILSKKIKNLLERIQHYPAKISKNLIMWCSKFENELIKIHHECSHVMGFGRLHFKNNDKEIVNLKKTSKLYDTLLGIPNLNKTNNKFCIPKKGYDIFFKYLKKYLNNKKVKINLSHKILIKKIDNKLVLTSLKKNIKADYFIWASNPVPLINILKIGKLDNPIIKTEVVTCDLHENNKKIKNRYIQIFSKESNIFRIYFYTLENRNKIVIELAFNKKKNDIKKELKFVQKVLSKFNYNFTFKNPIYETKQVRHVLFTVNDYKRFLKFEKMSKNLNVISGGWYLAGSKAKMDHIKKTIDKLNL
jgi:hypothetical protein